MRGSSQPARRRFGEARGPEGRGGVGRRLLSSSVMALAMCGAGVSAAGCSTAHEAATAVTAPLSVLPDTDAVVETNLTTASEGAIAGGGLGVQTTSGPSTSYNVISESSSPQVVVLAGFNQLSDDCLGLVKISAASVPVLGESQPGSYDFWVKGTEAASCNAASFAATSSVPQGWPAGDPSSAGWPLP